MQKLRTTIVLRKGVQTEILCTPSLYAVAVKRGISLAIEETDKTDATEYVDAIAVSEVYAKMIYCAAVNAWEVDNLEDPEAGPFPYSYSDFHEWAWTDSQGFRGAIDFMLTAMTGEGIVGHAKKVIKKKSALSR